MDKPTRFQIIHNLATVQVALAQFEKAKQNYQKVLDYNTSQENPDDLKNASTLHNYAILLWELGEYEEAKMIEQKVLTAFVEGYGENTSHSANSYNFLGTLEKLTGANLEKVEALYRKSLLINQELYGGQHKNIAYDYLDLGGVQLDGGKYTAALDNFKQAKALFISLFDKNHLEEANALNSIADIQLIQGDLLDALTTYRKSLAIYEDNYPRSYPDKSIVLNNIGKRTKHCQFPHRSNPQNSEVLAWMIFFHLFLKVYLMLHVNLKFLHRQRA